MIWAWHRLYLWRLERDRGTPVPFDVRQLRYAIAAADHGSIYRAARALEIEQSTLSRSISKLERVIGAKLFDRTRMGVTTTVAGSAFIVGARPMVASADKLVAMMRAAGQGRAGELVLGHNCPVSAGNLRATMLSFRDAHPDVIIECIEADRSTLLAGLNTGEIDIAVLMGTAGHQDFRCEPLWSERMSVALSVNHELAQRDIIYWTDLRSQQFHMTAADPGPGLRDMALSRLSVSGTAPDIHTHQCSRETILSILGAGGAVSIVCEGSTGTRYPELVYRPIHGEQGPALAGYMGYWLESNRNPPLRRFLDFIRQRYALTFDLTVNSKEQD